MILTLVSGATSTGPGAAFDLGGVSRDFFVKTTGGYVTVEGSLDGSNWYTVPDNSGTLYSMLYAKFLRANVTGVVTSVTCLVSAVDVQPGPVIELLPPGSSARTGATVDLAGLTVDYSVQEVGSNVRMEGSLDGVSWEDMDLHSGSRIVPLKMVRYIRGVQTASGTAALYVALGRVSRE